MLEKTVFENIFIYSNIKKKDILPRSLENHIR